MVTQAIMAIKTKLLYCKTKTETDLFLQGYDNAFPLRLSNEYTYIWLSFTYVTSQKMITEIEHKRVIMNLEFLRSQDNKFVTRSYFFLLIRVRTNEATENWSKFLWG